RTAQVAVVGLAVALLVAAAAIWQFFGAREATAKAQAHLREVQIMQSRFLADLARDRRAAGDAGSAVLLALEALPEGAPGTSRPYVSEAQVQLDGAWRDLRERLVLGHAGWVYDAEY